VIANPIIKTIAPLFEYKLYKSIIYDERRTHKKMEPLSTVVTAIIPKDIFSPAKKNNNMFKN
jgi:hypothetical protein